MNKIYDKKCTESTTSVLSDVTIVRCVRVQKNCTPPTKLQCLRKNRRKSEEEAKVNHLLQLILFFYDSLVLETAC